MTFLSANNGSRVLHTTCRVRTVMSGLVCASGFGSMQCGTGTSTPLGIYHMRAATLIGVPTGPFGRSSPPHQGGRGEGVGTVTLCWLRSTKETPMSELLMGPPGGTGTRRAGARRGSSLAANEKTTPVGIPP